MNIILELGKLAQAKGYSIINSENITLDTVHALLNFLIGDIALDERYQHHLCEQVNSNVTIDRFPIVTKQIEITSSNKPKTKASSDIGLTRLFKDNKKALDLLNKRK